MPRTTELSIEEIAAKLKDGVLPYQGDHLAVAHTTTNRPFLIWKMADEVRIQGRSGSWVKGQSIEHMMRFMPLMVYKNWNEALMAAACLLYPFRFRSPTPTHFYEQPASNPPPRLASRPPRQSQEILNSHQTKAGKKAIEGILRLTKKLQMGPVPESALLDLYKGQHVTMHWDLDRIAAVHNLVKDVSRYGEVRYQITDRR